MSRHLAAGLLLVFTAGAAGAADMLKTDKSEKHGTYLTDGEGRAVYMFEADRQGKGQQKAESTCYEGCAQAWPPLTADGKLQAGPQVDKSLIGSVKRKDGTEQITYNGWPLYYFVKDKGKGQATGQDVRGFGAEWYLLTAGGKKVGRAGEGRPAAAGATGSSERTGSGSRER